MPRNLSISTLVLLLVTILGSCEREDTTEAQRHQYAVVDAFLKTGQSISNINVTGLTANGRTAGISDLDIHIRGEESHYFLEENEEVPGNYFYDDREETAQAGETYRLSLGHKGKVVSAETVMPPRMEQLDVTSNTFRSMVPQEAIFIDWTDINDIDDSNGPTVEYFYFVKLSPLEEFETLELIEGKTRTDDTVRRGKIILNPRDRLTLDDFDYYGAHRLEVFAISNEYRNLFEEQSDFSANGLTNVKNGAGYFIGVSSLSTIIEVE